MNIHPPTNTHRHTHTHAQRRTHHIIHARHVYITLLSQKGAGSEPIYTKHHQTTHKKYLPQKKVKSRLQKL